MADQMRPASPQQAPDPSTNYERSHPGREAGMGRMDNNKAVPERSPDQSEQAASNRKDPTRQVNAQDTVNQRGGPPAVQPDHSMKDEEPLGWDQAPTDIHDPERQRQPRTEGKGGTP
jgi:hypothetical protein